MKTLLILPLVFICTSSLAQNIKLPADNTTLFKSTENFLPIISALDNKNSNTDFTQVSNNSAYLAVNDWHRSVKPYEPDPLFSNPMTTGEAVNAYTTQTKLGNNIKISCNYLYDDEGNLADIETVWDIK